MRTLVYTAVSSWKMLMAAGSERSRRAKKNIALSVLVKGGQVLINLLLVPLTINYINTERYGVWLTLSSLVMWINFLDVGLGHGMRNKLVEASVSNDINKGRIYVSTTYAALAIIAIIVLGVFLAVNHFLDWQSILNDQGIAADELNQAAVIAFSAFCVQLVLQNVNSIFMANHDPSKASLISLIGQTLVVFSILVLGNLQRADFTSLVWILTTFPPLVLIVSSVYLFKTSYRNFAPALHLVKFQYARELLSLGGRFFLINLGVIILYQSDNILVAQLFGSNEVTTFNIAYRLFFTVIMVLTIFLLPFWSAVTDAYLKDDLAWIRHSRSKYIRLIVALAGGCALMLACSGLIYQLWVGDAVAVPFRLSLFMAIYVVVYMFHSLHVNILNGMGKIRLQLYLVIACSVLNVLLAIAFGRMIGLEGIVLSNIVIFLIMTVAVVIQCNKLLTKTAFGIWDK